MKKILFAAMALVAFASCAKEQETPNPANADENQIEVTFVAAPNTDETRAFFDPTATTEV